jgi:hypothetical protein
MRQQENETVAYLMNEENGEQDFFQFADLELTDAQLAEVKGGPGTWCTQCVVVYSNHNEMTASDDTGEAEEDFFQFADLELTDEQLTEVKGGPGGGFGCSYCGGGLGNHNETTAEDDTEAAEDDFLQFADLSLTDEQLTEVKGGPGGGFGCSWCTLQGNHNETAAEDDATETEELNDLSVNNDQQAEVKGGVGITKLGSRRLILQGDGTYF